MAQETPTRYPGIFQRGSRFTFRYRINGNQRRGSARTITEARRLKRELETDRDRGDLIVSRQRFGEYALEWIESYQGLRDNTRREYKRDLERWAIPRLGNRRLSSLTPGDIRQWVAWLCEQSSGRKRKDGTRARLSDRSVRRIAAPLQSCLSTARADGLIRTNPADKIRWPSREAAPQVGDADKEKVRVLSREQLDALLHIVRPEHRLMFRLLAATGLRWSEVVELHWADFHLDGGEPCVRIRRALVKGAVGPPKSSHGKRDVPLSLRLASELRRKKGEPMERVFPSPTGQALDYATMRRDVLAPAAAEAGAEWAGFHTLRHQFASLHIARGTNILVLSRMLGHQSPEFTLKVYGHLIPGDRPPALDLDAEIKPEGGSSQSVPTPSPAEGMRELEAA